MLPVALERVRVTCGVSNRIGEKVGSLDSGLRVPSSVDIFSTSRSIIINDVSREIIDVDK